jgi:hypothetical protein
VALDPVGSSLTHAAAGVPTPLVTTRVAETATIGAGLQVDALEQLAAELGPGRNRTHRLPLGAAAYARSSVQLSFGQVQGQVDPASSELVPAEAHPWRALRSHLHPIGLLLWIVTDALSCMLRQL